MGVISNTYEFTVPVAPSRMFKAMGDTKNNLIPTLMPHIIKSIEFVGDGGVGTIKITNFVDASPVKYVKHRFDEIDEENYYCKFTLFEGDFGDDYDKLDCIVHEVKLEASGDGGSICNLSNHYHTKGEFVPKEEDIKVGEEQDKAIHVALVEHLVANPHLYA
uniref:Bet v I/Major latex protein domain-containing protein n=1 Tax=Kalanchoe fedtschenkoi TaxID=63787 RepID=A0A7N0RA00_KALFE